MCRAVVAVVVVVVVVNPWITQKKTILGKKQFSGTEENSVEEFSYFSFLSCQLCVRFHLFVLLPESDLLNIWYLLVGVFK